MTARDARQSEAPVAHTLTPRGNAARAGDEAGGDALGRLLEAERRRVEHLAEAEREAATILSEAHAAAAAREQSFLLGLDQEIAELRRRLGDECARTVAEADAAALREAARFDEMSGARIAAFAAALLDHVLSSPPSGPGASS
ncbi:MAG TPA: hypothetical protein VLE53_04335 [Gemmatimonadaceae bacterium]|nr:hypothetical protein [Gemmatimonadaceae bacterium]